MEFRDRLRNILSIKDSPHRLTVAFVAGVFIGMSPLLGFHVILGIAAAWIFGLNRVVTTTGVFVTNLWTIVPTYICSAYIGIKQTLPKIDGAHITFSNFLHELEPLLIPFIFGTLLIDFISAVISYFIICHAVKKEHSYGK